MHVVEQFAWMSTPPETNASPAIGDEVEEGCAEGTYATVGEHAVEHGAHTVLPDPESHLSPSVQTLLEDLGAVRKEFQGQQFACERRGGKFCLSVWPAPVPHRAIGNMHTSSRVR